MSKHEAAISWRRGARGFGFEEYSRDHAWSFDGGASLAATASPEYRGSAERVDPEEAFVAAVASCHMLTFLAIASRKRLVVDRYDDTAIGVMEKNASGRLAITRVVLRPRVVFAGEPPAAGEISRMHERAHENCFIANSVQSEIVVEPSDAAPPLPKVGEVLAPLIARVPRAEQPFLIALAERMAAERYRGWSALANDPEQRARLLACAEREEEIARRVEALQPAAAERERDLLAKHPELAELNRSLFAGRPLADQFQMQAAGERLGAATWRSFAKSASAPAEREVFLACAELEEASALVLESLLG